jgi:hypothetical protein
LESSRRNISKCFHSLSSLAVVAVLRGLTCGHLRVSRGTNQFVGN